MPARNLRQRLPMFYDAATTEPVGDTVELDGFDPLIGGEYELYIHNVSDKTAVFKNRHQKNGKTEAILPDKIRPHETAKVRLMIAGSDNPDDAMEDATLNLSSDIDWENPSFFGAESH